MNIAVPEKAIIRHGDVVGRSPPLAHQNGAGARQRRRRRLVRIGGAVAKHPCRQPIEFLGHGLGEPAVVPFLSRIGDAEGENVSAERRGWALGKLFCP
jgi:hypothetical protein